MEWVVTTGRTIEDAREAALDELGVDEDEVELEVLEDVTPGLFGRIRREARVRARVRPRVPRPKAGRRERRGDRKRRGRGRDGKRRDGRKGKGGQKGSDRRRTKGRPEQKDADEGPSAEREPERSDEAPDEGREPAGDDAAAPAPGTGGRGTPRAEKRTGKGPRRSSDRGDQHDDNPSAEGDGNQRRRDDAGRSGADAGEESTEMSSDQITVDEQADIVVDFLDGLLDAFDLDGSIETEEVDEDTIEVHVDGEDLGLLIGPKGQTLAAVQELAQTTVQRKAAGSLRGRVRVDVGGYRRRRREALARFAGDIAEQVLSSGSEKALEPMNAADRKVVHDTVNEIDGVATVSEGDEPRRRVIIVPE